MAVKIKLKLKKQVNAASDKNPPHGKNSSNKVINIAVGLSRIAMSYPEHRVHILKPIIDRLVLRYDPIKGWSDKKKKNFETCVYSYVDEYEKAGDWGYEYVPNEEQNKNEGLYRAYKRNVWLKHEPTGENILVQTDPKKAGTPFFRFDFNPSKLGAKGVIFFKKEMSHLFGGTDYDLGYKDILNDPKAIYRVDIAVDMLGVDVSDLELVYHPHGSQKKQVKAVEYGSEVGRTETIYPNALLSGSNKTYVYNKKAAAKDKGKDPMFEEALHSRFEHRYTKWNKPMQHLLNITPGKNPLKKVDIRWIDYKAIERKSHAHVLFLQYAKSRGLDKALELKVIELAHGIGAPPHVIDILKLSKQQEYFTCLLPCIMQMEKSKFCETVSDINDTPRMVGAYLEFAYCKHTRSGKSAFRLLLKSCPNILDFIRKHCERADPVNIVGWSDFILNGRILNERIIYDGSECLRELAAQAWLYSGGMPIEVQEEFLSLMNNHIEELYNARQAVVR